MQEFGKRDLKGAYDMRHYIVYDYEWINLSIIDVALIKAKNLTIFSYNF